MKFLVILILYVGDVELDDDVHILEEYSGWKGWRWSYGQVLQA